MKRIATLHTEGKVTGWVHGPDVINQTIEAGGKKWYFDFDVQFGPLWLGKKGKELTNQNVPKYVWPAFEAWLAKWKEAKV